MFDAESAKKVVRAYVPGATIEECVPSQGDFIVRVSHNSPEEEDFDPFFLVDGRLGHIQEFSVMEGNNADRLAAAFGAQSTN